MDELFLMAGKLKAAGTPGTVREIYKKLQENQKTGASNVQPSAVNADFMGMVMDYKAKNGTSYKTAYLAMRKAHPDVFDRWLESVQG